MEPRRGGRRVRQSAARGAHAAGAAPGPYGASGVRPARQAPPRRSGVPVFALVLAIVLAAVAGALVDRFLLGAGVGGTLGGKVTLSEGELSATVATYSYGGQRVALSAREVLEGQGRLESAVRADGSYGVPTADDVLAVARGRIIAGEAERRGITVSEQDALGYAEAAFGTRSLAEMAAVGGTSEQAVYAQLEQAALMQRLRAEVVSAERPEAPAMPPEPEEGEEVVPLEKYGAYVVGLAGAEWDAAADGWASSEGAFASALAGYEVSAESATYDAALQAYWVAYEQYVQANSEVSALWTDYVNSLLSEANIAISTLAI